MTYRRHSDYMFDRLPAQTLTPTGKRETGGSRINIQDAFLNHCRREKVGVASTLLNGAVCSGTIVGFDNVVIALEQEGKQTLVFKTAIMQVDPVVFVNYIFNDAYRPDAYRQEDSHTRPEHPDHFA